MSFFYVEMLLCGRVHMVYLALTPYVEFFICGMVVMWNFRVLKC